MVLGLYKMGLSPHCHLLRTGLVNHLVDLRHLSSRRNGNLSETSPAAERRRDRLARY
jgi:hypothetical protein